MTDYSHDSIKTILKKDILFEGLELADLGIGFDEITDDVMLIGDFGLGLDSVDALEILSLVQRHFGIEVARPSKEFFQQNLASFDKLFTFVIENLREPAVQS